MPVMNAWVLKQFICISKLRDFKHRLQYLSTFYLHVQVNYNKTEVGATREILTRLEWEMTYDDFLFLITPEPQTE